VKTTGRAIRNAQKIHCHRDCDISGLGGSGLVAFGKHHAAAAPNANGSAADPSKIAIQ